MWVWIWGQPRNLSTNDYTSIFFSFRSLLFFFWTDHTIRLSVGDLGGWSLRGSKQVVNRYKQVHPITLKIQIQSNDIPPRGKRNPCGQWSFFSSFPLKPRKHWSIHHYSFVFLIMSNSVQQAFVCAEEDGCPDRWRVTRLFSAPKMNWSAGNPLWNTKLLSPQWQLLTRSALTKLSQWCIHPRRRYEGLNKPEQGSFR